MCGKETLNRPFGTSKRALKCLWRATAGLVSAYQAERHPLPDAFDLQLVRKSGEGRKKLYFFLDKQKNLCRMILNQGAKVTNVKDLRVLKYNLSLLKLKL